MIALTSALAGAAVSARAGIDGDPGVIGPRIIHPDPPGDAVVRHTDLGPGLAGPQAPSRVIDLLGISLGTWEPEQPHVNLFEGAFVNSGAFFRIDLIFRGLVNPPGSIDPFSFTPFRYGPRPLYGFVEIDMDRDVNTGGEIEAPQFRYLANVARFGGNVTRPDLRPRVALTGEAVDHNLHTPPHIERSGEEFHLAFLGVEFDPDDIEVVFGNSDRRFDPGEVWVIAGRFLHRAHAFEPFSFAEGGLVPGEYMPFGVMQYAHHLLEDVTYVSFVFPLTNLGAARMFDEPLEPNDHDPTNQASILEALEDLQLSAKLIQALPIDDPAADLLVNWADHNPRGATNVKAWRMTALLGTTYGAPDGNAVRFLWTDVFPNVIRGDVDGSGRVDPFDAARIFTFVTENDGFDGLLDDRVRIPDFAVNFSVADLNYDGFVDVHDIRLADRRGDDDDDGDIDLRDIARLQNCFGRRAMDDASVACLRMDVTGDGVVDLADLEALRARFGGPGGPTP